MHKGGENVGTQAWNKENSVLFGIRFTKNSGIPDALRVMHDKTGEREQEYIRRAIVEALTRDGYISHDKKEP